MNKNIILFFMISVILIACSKTSDQEYFDQAKMLLKEKKISEAIKAIETLIKDYPESKIAPKALIQLASIYGTQYDEVPILPNNPWIKDTHQIEIVKSEESYNISQKYYRQVFDKYPDSPEAPTSLFMSSFVLANNLKKYDEATLSYKLFLSRYPSHPLAVSAQEELDNMGLSPEEILKRSETAKN